MARGRSLPLAAAVLASLGLAALVLAQAPEPTPTPVPAPESAQASAAEAPPVCGDCHTEEVAKFAGNPHARWSHKDKKPDLNSFCSTCHGDGIKHMEAGGDASLIDTFKGVSGAEQCLACHQKTDEHASFATGFHGNSATVN